GGASPAPAMAAVKPYNGLVYYGWIVLLVAAAGMVGTLPGRTQGLGLVTEPLMADLAITRVDYAQLNLWATLIGSLFAIGVGRFVDRLGTRVVLTAVSIILGAVVVAMSNVQTFWALAIAVTLTRGFGQSALSVISLAMVGQWFVRRIDIAMAIYSIVMSIGFMIAFPIVGSMVQAIGWRAAWLSIGVALIVVLAPLAWLFVRRNPESIGEVPDGVSYARNGGPSGPPVSADDGATWQEALATPAFWTFSIGAALYGLVASGIGLFNESILAERGFNADVYYQTLVVTALTALAGNFGGGWLALRMQLSTLLAISLVVLALGVAALPHVSSIMQVMIWATAMGLGGGLVMVLFFSVWPRVYGRRHLGRIQGAAQAMTVVASAVGPLLLAWCVELTGSYSGMFNILAGLIGIVAMSALITPMPAASARVATV
ncbi:MAG TPA: MFS transporter, partial [Vicinamibacterales bacterium]|nr:MFS transporter [Vicinamibacterales bacterium]